MKILTSQQIRQADQHTIKNQPIASIDLMEKAAGEFTGKFNELFPNAMENILIFCGTGNNGGDGLAIARMLHNQHRKIQVFTIGDLKKSSKDFQENHERIQHQTNTQSIESKKDFPNISSSNVIIDGLFGSGLSRPVEGLLADLIHHINGSTATIVSIDIASGLLADSPSVGEAIIRPDHTISFQVPKLAFFQPALHEHVGELHIVDIGLDKNFIQHIDTQPVFMEADDVKPFIPSRKKFAHKGDAGRLLIIAGSRGKMGAAILAAQSAFRSGAGLVHVHAPACGLNILQTSIPEAMVMVDEDDKMITKINVSSTINAIAIGPGIGTHEHTANALHQLIEISTIPLLLDADALNILAQHPAWLKALPLDSILTPHPGEFERLVGKWNNDFDKLEKLRSLCRKNKLNMVLKGAYSAVCDSNGNLFFNSTGNPGMATAGSGDVLTGIIGALLGQGVSPISSLQLGVYVHGLAGDLASRRYGHLSLKASDMIKELPNAFLTLVNS